MAFNRTYVHENMTVLDSMLSDLMELTNPDLDERIRANELEQRRLGAEQAALIAVADRPLVRRRRTPVDQRLPACHARLFERRGEPPAFRRPHGRWRRRGRRRLDRRPDRDFAGGPVRQVARQPPCPLAGDRGGSGARRADDGDLRTERRWTCACRCRCDTGFRARQHSGGRREPVDFANVATGCRRRSRRSAFRAARSCSSARRP